MSATALEFLDLLFGDLPPHSWISCWSLKTGKTAWFQTPEAAASWADGRRDVHIGCGLRDQNLGPGKRGTAANVIALPGFWADIDFADGDAHKGTNLPQNAEEALAFARTELELRPTILVHSGHGIQAWWLFKELWELGDENRGNAAALSAGWNEFVASRGAKHGWILDRTGDLARVLRIPGTINAKGDPVPVEIIEANPDSRYMVDDFERIMSLMPRPTDEAAARREAKSTNGVDWKTAPRGSSAGERNNALASYLGKLAYEIGDIESEGARGIIIESARMAGALASPPLDEKEIITTVRSVIGMEASRRASQAALDRTVEAMATEGGADESEMLALVRESLGGLPLAAVEKIGKTDSSYCLILTDGLRIDIADLTAQRAVRRKVMDATRGASCWHTQKDKDWTKTCQLLVRLAEEFDTPDTSTKDSIEIWISEYLDHSRKDIAAASRETALEKSEPFFENGNLFISIPSLHTFLKFRYQSASTAEIRKGLLLLGFRYSREYASVKKNEDEPTRRICRGYWVGPFDR